MTNLQTKQIKLPKGLPVEQVLNSLPLQGGRATDNAFAVREIFKDHFFSPVGRIVPSDNKV